MTYSSLSLTLLFVFIPLILSKTLKLGLERDTIIATIRSVIQLLAVGYLLNFIFNSESTLYMLLMITLMIFAATMNARKKGKIFRALLGKLPLHCFQ